MSMTVDLARAVRDRLNGVTLPEAFTAELVWYPKAELKDLDELEVIVVPRPVEREAYDRGVDQLTFTVDVAVQKPLESTGQDEQIEALIDLTERLCQALAGAGLAGAPWARWSGSRVDPVFVPEHLHQHDVFTSVVRTTYKAVKER